MKFIVEGMTCSHCERSMSKAIEHLGGRAQVDLSAGTVAVESLTDEAAARAAIEEEGYQVTGHANEPASAGPGAGAAAAASEAAKSQALLHFHAHLGKIG